MNSTWRDRPAYESCLGHREGALGDDEYDYEVPIDLPVARALAIAASA
jgi:hypothetical protein